MVKLLFGVCGGSGLRLTIRSRCERRCRLSETGSETTDPLALKKHFHKISKVEIKAADGSDFTTGTVEITSVPGGFETTLKTVNDEFPGWTLEPEVGGEPWLVTKGVPIGAEIEVGESIGATIDILSNRVDKRRTIEGGDTEQFTPTAVQHPDEFPFVGRTLFLWVWSVSRNRWRSRDL